MISKRQGFSYGVGWWRGLRLGDRRID